MKALVIAPQPFFSPRGTPLSVYHRTLVAAELGVEIDLLTYGEGRDVDLPGVRIHRIPRLAFLGPVPVGPSFTKLVLDAVLLLWAVGRLLRTRYDFVHAHEEAVFLCLPLRVLFRFRLVYDMHSSLPQQLSSFAFTRSRLLIGLFEALEARSLARADAVIAVCPALAEYAGRRARPGRVLLIENTLCEPVRLRDTAEPDRADPPALPAGRRLVVYAGSFEPYQGVDLAVDAFPAVREERPEAFLVLVGGSPEQVAAVAARAGERGLDGHCLLTGRVDPATAESLQREADVLISPRRTGMNTPLKIYAQLASGVPLVATRIPAHTQVLDDEVCFLVEPDAPSLARGILAALGDTARRAAVVESARARFDPHRARADYEARMRALLERLA